MSEHSAVTGKAFFMMSISTMEHTKTAGGRTLFQRTKAPAPLNIYWTGQSYDRPAGSINNCSLELEDSSSSFALKTTGRVMP